MSNDESDSLAVRLHRLFTLVRVPSGAEEPPFWLALGDHIRKLMWTETLMNDTERTLASLLEYTADVGALSDRDLDMILRYVGASDGYLDLSRPRFETETQLLLAQLDRMGVSAFRMCRAYMREFDRVKALELLVDVTSGVAPRVQEIDPRR
ncbi:hypothetical protein AD006_32320 (plasmid) [Pseudonocardia sp. EC080610-09]|uniref:hypothetical protein n=1 Tax=Pseudonocardia sp. EC080610-09 TaxID=1688404 RepID=UPI0007061949|nr:hypothetical protein [Pseudonocardia sp. EC080610-09]ALL79924.1 hypothetical protein AD006_32320 [Pseudonocardia sp. EC080610-09]